MDPTMIKLAFAGVGTLAGAATVGLTVWGIAIRQGRRIAKLERIATETNSHDDKIDKLTTEVHGLGVMMVQAQQAIERIEKHVREQAQQAGEVRGELGVLRQQMLRHHPPAN
jgi:HAMP domain-containing protein